jgi:ornithine carbamoyltransferase
MNQVEFEAKDVKGRSEKGKRAKDFLSLGELQPYEFQALLDLADRFKLERKSRNFDHQIPGTSLALLFEKPSTRTRVSFEVAMFELGGHAVVLNSRDMQLSRGETLEDTARTLSQYCQAICARVFSHETLVEFSRAVDIPVINALSDSYHPCQIVADIQAIREVKKNLKGLKVAWVGDGNNVCNSFIIGASLSGINVTVACPKNHVPKPEALKLSREKAQFTGSSVLVTENPEEAVASADVVVTDAFVSMGDEQEKEQRLRDFVPKYQVNQTLLSKAKSSAVFMHCLPAHRGEEVTKEVIDGPKSIVWREAENRLHAQKAILYTLLTPYANDME